MQLLSFFSTIKKQDSTNQEGFAPYEEIDAKKTSTLGYFFLVLMVIFGVWQGNNFLDSLEGLITSPAPNSYCLSKMEQWVPDYTVMYAQSTRSFPGYDYNPYSYGYGNTALPACTFSEREKELGIPAVYEKASVMMSELERVQADLQSANSQLSSSVNNRRITVDDYGVSLLETIAKKNPVLNQGDLQGSVASSSTVIQDLTTTVSGLKKQQDTKTAELTSFLAQHRVEFKKADNGYSFDMTVYELKRFALRLLFIAPMFWFFWRRYNISKNKRSEFALIWGGVVAITALLLTQVLLVFVYRILPHELLQKVFAFLVNFKFFFVVAYWLGFILVPLFFGFLIYIIQKKYYNKKAITMRAFKSNKCPKCTMSVAPHMVFCPTCGTTLKVKCTSCGGNTPNAGDFCELCGVKKVEVTTVLN